MRVVFTFSLDMYLTDRSFEPFGGHYHWLNEVEAHEKRTHWKLWHAFHGEVTKQISRIKARKLKACGCERISKCITDRTYTFHAQAFNLSNAFDREYGGEMDKAGYGGDYSFKAMGYSLDFRSCYNE
jgi:hypothetical protein